jgi:hypothetical protein
MSNEAFVALVLHLKKPKNPSCTTNDDKIKWQRASRFERLFSKALHKANGDDEKGTRMCESQKMSKSEPRRTLNEDTCLDVQ